MVSEIGNTMLRKLVDDYGIVDVVAALANHCADKSAEYTFTWPSRHHAWLYAERILRRVVADRGALPD
jgi:hypothetical protein